MTEIRPMDQVDPKSIKYFTDQEIGDGYYSVEEIKQMVDRSSAATGSCSFVLLNKDQVGGIRISFPPGQWQHGKGQALSPHRWPFAIDQTAYFQSLFIAPELQKKGWGTKLSKISLTALKKTGALGVLCHSWVESPGDSSRKYLASLNFKSICQYPEYWKNVDYICPRCGQPCLCTAEEMYLDLKETDI